MLLLEVELLKNMIEGTETRDHAFDLIYSVVKFSNGRQLFFSSPCQRQSELLPSLGVCRPLTFNNLTFSSETAAK
jgi:hypothetical protein